MGAKVRSNGANGQGHFGNKTDESAMNTPSEPVDVAILAFAETTASVTFGIYDLLMAAGRDWGFVVAGQPGPSLMHPRIVSAKAGTFLAANDVPITPQATIADAATPRVVCVPELAVPPADPLAGRFARGDRVAAALLRGRRDDRHRVLRRRPARRDRRARRARGHDALGVLRRHARRAIPGCACARSGRSSCRAKGSGS